MIKLLIAEDEILSLEDLENLPWNSVGIDAVFTAENGAKAYDLALIEKPEIILTDIQMPKMGGLELSEKLSSILPESKFIFLTAHDNFDYAKAAVENRVLSYILKPFDENELLAAVKKAADMIKTERDKSSYHTYIVKQLERSRHFLMGYFFGALESNEDDVNNLLQILNITHPETYYTAVVVTLASPSPRQESVFTDNYQAFMQITQLLAEEDEEVLSFFNTSHLVYFVGAAVPFSPTEPQNIILKLADTAKSYLDKNQHTNYLITIGNSVAGIKNCEAAYRSALNAISYSFYLGFNTIICIEDVEPSNSVGYFQAIQDEQFFNIVKAGNFEGARFLLHRMFRSFSENRLAVNEMQHICHSVLVRLAICLLQCGQNPDFLFNKTNALDVIRQYTSIKNLEAFMTDIIDVVTSNIAINHSQRDKELITSIKEYISANPKTSLTKIAGYFHHSPNYLSSIFSKDTGDTIKNYIINVRMNYAKELLKNSPRSIGQIATDVGYKTQQHFCNVFNKTTGMTPSDYRSFNTDELMHQQ